MMLFFSDLFLLLGMVNAPPKCMLPEELLTFLEKMLQKLDTIASNVQPPDVY